MQATKRQQRGAFLVLIALTIIALLGIGSLALDIGRVFVLRAEMQQAVDAAALAAAVELDHTEDSRERAMDAARHTISENSRFARISELLGEGGLPDAAFTFFCVIGSPHDIDPDTTGFDNYCSGAASSENGKYFAIDDNDSNYVRITLDSTITNTDQYKTDLIFLPLLQLLNIDTIDVMALTANALAGRSFYACNYAPMMICNPFESTGDFKEKMKVGGHIEIKNPSNNWGPGNFGFLDAGSGANDLAHTLANEGLTGCQDSVITTEPGNMTNPTANALNTRFDAYSNPFFGGSSAPGKWPPAPNITEYGLDATTTPVDSRFGNGDWDFAAHKQALIAAGKSVASMPTTWGVSITPTRWEVYNWEINQTPSAALTLPITSHLNVDDDGDGDNQDADGIPLSNAERRLMYVAVLSCNAIGMSGKTTTPVFPPDGFAKMFLIRKAEGPSGPNKGTIWAEYVGWENFEADGEMHVDIQLYE